MRVLLIDNYDSFAWNLVQALRVLGADVVVRRNDAVTVHEALALAPSAIVLSPGPGRPADAGISVPLVRAAAAVDLPLLGVCLGHQAIGEAFCDPSCDPARDELGGRVQRASSLVHGKTSWITHTGGNEFAGVSSPFEAMRYHSLVVGEPLPPDLVATARTLAGGDAVSELMGVRHRTLPIVGWQFHPESHYTPQGPRLLSNFLALAAARGAACTSAPGVSQ